MPNSLPRSHQLSQPAQLAKSDPTDQGGSKEAAKRSKSVRRRPPALVAPVASGSGVLRPLGRKSPPTAMGVAAEMLGHEVVAGGATGAAGEGDFVAQLAAAVRQRRTQMGWTVANTAAWCGVGSRFWVDLEMAKPNLQIERAIAVARKMGIDLALTPRMSAVTTNMPEAMAPNWHVVKAPAGCRQPAAWLALCHAAHHIAQNSGLNVLKSRLVGPSGLPSAMAMDTSPWAGQVEDFAFSRLKLAPDANLTSPGEGVRMPWSAPTPEACWEENGGPGIKQALAYIAAKSLRPVQDTEQLVRWIIFSTVCLDGELNLARLRFLKPAGSSFGQLGALGEVLCASTHFESRPHRGLRIGNAWPELHLREDQWRKLAELAGIHPKVIFQMMREMSARAPGLLDEALQGALGEIPRTSALVQVIRGVRMAATRMGDLSMAAARNNIAGLKTKTQPRIEPVQTRIAIEPSRRFISVVDDEGDLPNDE